LGHVRAGRAAAGARKHQRGSRSQARHAGSWEVAVGRLIAFALLSVLPVAAWGQGTFLDPSAFGDSLWRGEVADEDALATCDEDTASSVHWLLDPGALAHCPPDGSDWEVYTFGGGGGGDGTVTSVAFDAPTGFTIAGSPITTSG